MKILDGRNAHEIPRIIDINLEDINILEIWKDYHNTIYCVKIDDQLIPCVLNKGNRYDGIFCTSYKTYNGFKKWVNRFYESARKVR